MTEDITLEQLRQALKTAAEELEIPDLDGTTIGRVARGVLATDQSLAERIIAGEADEQEIRDVIDDYVVESSSEEGGGDFDLEESSYIEPFWEDDDDEV